MPGPATIFYTCRTTILALENASDIAAKVDSASGMTAILPSAHWRNTLHLMRSNIGFWVSVFCAQFCMLALAFWFALTIQDVGGLLDVCRDSNRCEGIPKWATWLAFVGRSGSIDSFRISLALSFSVPGFLFQAGWMAAARYAVIPRPLTRNGWTCFRQGVMDLPRAGWLGALPMRFVAWFAQWGTTPLQRLEWRWTIMILGRFCHFTLLALLAKGVPTDQIAMEAKRAIEKHHMEMLDAFGTYNIIFSVCMGITLFLVGIVYFTESVTIARSFMIGAALILSAPMIFARLLMIAHFSRVIGGHVATP